MIRDGTASGRAFRTDAARVTFDERRERDGTDRRHTEIVSTGEVLSGDPRIDGTRIGVYTVGDADPDRIADDYDLSLAEVHAALSYAFANGEETRAIERRTTELRDDPAVLTPDN